MRSSKPSNSLLQRKIQPPFKPAVESALDVANFDAEFTSEAALDSVVEDSHLSATVQVSWEHDWRLVLDFEGGRLCGVARCPYCGVTVRRVAHNPAPSSRSLLRLAGPLR